MTFEQFLALIKHDATSHPAVGLLKDAVGVLERELAGYQAQAAAHTAPAAPPAPAPAPAEAKAKAGPAAEGPSVAQQILHPSTPY